MLTGPGLLMGTFQLDRRGKAQRLGRVVLDTGADSEVVTRRKGGEQTRVEGGRSMRESSQLNMIGRGNVGGRWVL